MKPRLAIVTTHPIQYNAPFFAMLHQRQHIELKVFYTWSQAVKGEKFDPGFNAKVGWDIPLLDGYEWEAVLNTSKDPGSSHFSGIENPTLIKCIEEYAPDALLVYGWNFKSHLQLMRSFKRKIPILFRGDSTLLNEDGWLKRTRRKIVLKYVYSFIDFALYAGKANYNYFKFAGVKNKQLVFMPHAIENKRFVSSVVSSAFIEKLKKKFGVPADKLIVLFSGKLTENKNIEQLCRVVANMPSLPVYLLVAGSGPLEEILQNKYGNSSAIHFAGFQNQAAMPAIYQLAEVLVLPSKKINETWGLCVNEAMAAGRAIIASDGCGAAHDLVLQNVNGFMYKTNDEAALIKHLGWMAKNKDRLKEMGNGSKNIISEYSFEKDCIAVENQMKNLN